MFFCTDAQEAGARHTIIGEYHPKANRFVLNHEQIAKQRLISGKIPPPCYNCLNLYHCARECPDRCMVRPQRAEFYQNDSPPFFRCGIYQELSKAWLLELGKDCHHQETAKPMRISADHWAQKQILTNFLSSAPFFLDRNAIIHKWEAVREHFHLNAHNLLRGEDLMALGASADGEVGDFIYRHPEYRQYMTTTEHDQPTLQGGMYKTAAERQLHAITTELMGAHVRQERFIELDAQNLLEKWLNCGFLIADSTQTAYRLTGNGSWFLKDMLFELEKYGKRRYQSVTRFFEMRARLLEDKE